MNRPDDWMKPTTDPTVEGYSQSRWTEGPSGVCGKCESFLMMMVDDTVGKRIAYCNDCDAMAYVGKTLDLQQ